MTPTVDIVIVNWNAGPQLRACLESIASTGRNGYALRRVVVVDNMSVDASLDGLTGLGLPLSLIRNQSNRGFAAACNQGAEASAAEYLLFLNPDTELFADSIENPVAFMESGEARGVGICGIRLVDDRGEPAVSAATFPSPRSIVAEATGLTALWPARFPSPRLRLADRQGVREVDQVIGAFFLVRAALFRHLRGFDERFFVYYEEVDLSVRAKALGFRSVLLAGTEARHLGGVSSSQVRASRLFYSLRSRLLYGQKHFGAGGNAALVFATSCELFTRLALAASRLSRVDAAETLRAYGRLVAWRLGRFSQLAGGTGR